MFLSDFLKNYDKNATVNRQQTYVWRRFFNLSVYFFVTRIILLNFAAETNVITMNRIFNFCCLVLMVVACEIVDNDMEKHVKPSVLVSLEDMAAVMANVPFTEVQMNEVYDAVLASSTNGYDEEYTMKNLFTSPGSGVGDDISGVKAADRYDIPMKQLIEDYVRSSAAVKSGSMISDPDAWLQYMTESDMQIYWPFSENWDGKEYPIITYDPEDNSTKNVGYRITVDDDGFRHVEEVLVDEEMAMESPVWVVNMNSDAGHKTLELQRREDPDWGNGGGTVIVQPSSATKASSILKTLMLKDFTMNRNYDSWFAGASEFWVKIGSVEDFTASTEAELRLYNPTVTDFLIVVKRNKVGKRIPFNAILVSDWSDQLDSCALMITEDDGGTIKDWTCNAVVKVNSKSYGIEIKIPFNSHDDIVWRGSLSRKWFEANDNITGHFGDIDLTFEVVGN